MLLALLSSLKLNALRLNWLYSYYRDHHLEAVLPGCALGDKHGTTFGYLEEARLKQGRLYLRGWALGSGIRFRLGDVEIQRHPHEAREDVAATLGCDKHVGFQASLPCDDHILDLELEHDAGTLVIQHDLKVSRRLRRAKLRIAVVFLKDIVSVLPMIIKGLRAKDPDLPRQVKAALQLLSADTNLLLDKRFLAENRASQGDPCQQIAQAKTELTVIMPIYNAFDLLGESLGRIVENTDMSFRLVLIEDASTDERVRPWLRSWVSRHQERYRIDLIENRQNLGFIGSVNTGFHLALNAPDEGQGPVVLLNSDAMVPPGWASRLIEPLRDPQVATVTPLSNDAEIFTAPVICKPHALDAWQGDQIDAALSSRIAYSAPEISAPTGVGFCMAMQRSWLERVVGFDEIFGRGYGEEVDWCRRAAALGGKHVVMPRLFVEHRGGASFGPEKLELVRKNNEVISKRYTDYNKLVQDFIKNDPLITPRLVAALAWAESLADLNEIPVYIAHSLGGGAENYLQQRIRDDRVSLVLRFGGHFRCHVALDTPFGRVSANTDDLELLVALVTPLTKRRIVYSCAVGDPNLGELPELLLRLAQGAKLEILFHDYLPISPSYTLLDHDGCYRGVPMPQHADAAHQYRSANGQIIPLTDWRKAWSDVVSRAERIVVFSPASARIVEAAFPKAASHMLVVPHSVDYPSMPSVGRSHERVTIGVLGAIAPHKGAAVVSALSRKLQGRKDIQMALIGRIAPGYPVARRVPIHGRYNVEDIADLAQRYQITHWLIPSVWPETFSYTVHECLATGLPTLAFDLGAQGDAVKLAPNGIVLPWNSVSQEPEQLADSIIAAVCLKSASMEHL